MGWANYYPKYDSIECDRVKSTAGGDTGERNFGMYQARTSASEHLDVVEDHERHDLRDRDIWVMIGTKVEVEV
jgi:hypothetical protein